MAKNTTKTMTSSSQTKFVKYIDLFCGLGAFHIAFNRKTRPGFVDYKCVPVYTWGFDWNFIKFPRYILDTLMGLQYSSTTS